jgi:long-chain acyl-CoA synthetase
MPHVGAVDGTTQMNLAHLIDDHDPNVIALIAGTAETSYGDLRDQVAHLRGGLAVSGVNRGDRVAIICGNNRHFVISYLAIVGIGAVAVPLNPSSPKPEIVRELNVVEPSAVIIGPSAIQLWAGVDRESVPSIGLVVVAEGNAIHGAKSIDELLAAEQIPIVDVDGDHVALLMFTSGTAGAPRAAMLSHRNLISNIEQGLTAPAKAEPGDVVFGVLPLFHVFGLAAVVGASLAVGATILLVQRFDPATAVDLIVERQVTVVPGAPPMWVAFCHFDELADDSFGSVRIALSGASRLPIAVADRFEERFGVAICEGYGLTEASPVVTTSSGVQRRPGSVGRVLLGQEVRLAGDGGSDVPVGDGGEIWVRGDNIFLGYWNEPEASARVLVDGWLRTGDIATVDDDGYLYLVDRAKDLIIVSGFNVFPAEVEGVLASHPLVAEVGVVGVPHPHHGEAVKAYVARVEGADVDEDQLINYAEEYLARYKCPTSIVFVSELPKNATGKLIRRELDGSILSS